jgi:hypothetical protein
MDGLRRNKALLQLPDNYEATHMVRKGRFGGSKNGDVMWLTNGRFLRGS